MALPPELSPQILHRPHDTSYPCQPAAFARPPADRLQQLPAWLDLGFAMAEDLCGLVHACPGQQQLEQAEICTNATQIELQGRAVLVSMLPEWRPWLNWPVRYLPPSADDATAASFLSDGLPRPECSPYVVATALDLLGAKAVIFSTGVEGQPPPLLQALVARPVPLPVWCAAAPSCCAPGPMRALSSRCPVRSGSTVWREHADALGVSMPAHVGLRHYRSWEAADEPRPAHLAAPLLATDEADATNASGLAFPAAAASFSPAEQPAVRAPLRELRLSAACLLPAGHPWDGAAWERCAACYAAPEAAAGEAAAVRGAVALYAPANRSQVRRAPAACLPAGLGAALLQPRLRPLRSVRSRPASTRTRRSRCSPSGSARARCSSRSARRTRRRPRPRRGWWRALP